MINVGFLDWDIDYVYVRAEVDSDRLKCLDDYPGKGHYGLGGGGIYFESTEDATFFALRWG
jgi:hypothetical protein